MDAADPLTSIRKRLQALINHSEGGIKAGYAKNSYNMISANTTRAIAIKDALEIVEEELT